jgi:carbon-monoxide dehydrogenase medium subunit
VSADDFFTGLFSTAIEPGELLTEITVPKAGRRTGFAFQEISRRHGDFALVGVAASVTLDEAGKCSGARIALLSVGDRPMLAEQAAKALADQTPRRPMRPPMRTSTPRAIFMHRQGTAASWHPC